MTVSRRSGTATPAGARGRAATRGTAPSDSSARPWLQSYDPGVPPDVDIPEVTVDVLARQAAERYPSRDALVFFGRRTTFGDLDRAVDAFAAYLRGLGLGSGDVVSLHLPTSPAFVIAFLGTLRAGCIVSPMSPLLVERELEILLRETKPRLSVVLDLLLPRVAGVRSRLGDTLRATEGMGGVIVTGIQDSLPAPIRWLYPIKARREGRWKPVSHSAETPNLFRIVRDTPAQRVESTSSPDEPAVLQCTGGTTGIPKAAVLTHRNLVANAVQCVSVLAGGRDDASTVLCALPYFHIYGLTVAMNFSLMLGLTQVLHPRFEPDVVLKSIDRFKPRFFPGAPIFYARLLDEPKLGRYDLRSIEACISGAAPLPQLVQERFEAVTGGRLCEGYGLTEASPVTHVNPIRGRRKAGTIGLPMPGTDAKIVDLDTATKVLAPGEIGELCVRGPQVMAGYYNRARETSDVMVDGWLHTGDVATMDADGYFAIVDRVKDMIIVSGANVYPSEVEEVLAAHPAVAEAAVIGIPDDHKGEVPKAYVVLRPDATTTAADLHAHCVENLSPYKVPVDIEIRTELPKTMIGKVLRRELEREHEASAASGVT